MEKVSYGTKENVIASVKFMIVKVLAVEQYVKMNVVSAVVLVLISVKVIVIALVTSWIVIKFVVVHL